MRVVRVVGMVRRRLAPLVPPSFQRRFRVGRSLGSGAPVLGRGRVHGILGARSAWKMTRGGREGERGRGEGGLLVRFDGIVILLGRATLYYTDQPGNLAANFRRLDQMLPPLLLRAPPYSTALPAARPEAGHAVRARVMGALLGRGPRAEYTAQRRAEQLVRVLLLRLLQRRRELVDRGQGPASARLRGDVETLHQPPLLLTILLTPRTYGQLFKATVYGAERKTKEATLKQTTTKEKQQRQNKTKK